MFKLQKYIWITSLLSCTIINDDVENHSKTNQITTCIESDCWDSSICVKRDSHYIDLFTRNEEWTGGDATYSTLLSDGRRLWMFGDTFIDQVNPDRSRPTFHLIRNSLVLQENNQFNTLYAGTRENPKSFLTPNEPDSWYWPGDATQYKDIIYLFLQGFTKTSDGDWGFERIFVDLVLLDPKTMSPINKIRISEDGSISWGACILENDSDTFIYGVKSGLFGKELYVAKTSPDMCRPWEYWTLNGWSHTTQDGKPIFRGVSEQFSIFKEQDSYYFLTQNSFLRKEIFLYKSESPTGAFIDKKTIYCTPETGGNIITYNAFVHEDVYLDSLLVSYNVNSLDFSDLLKNADNYRPYFVKVGNWK